MQDIIQTMLPYYKFQDVMARFVPGLKSTAPDRMKLYKEESFTWGPGGSMQTVFSNWCDLHREFFGKEHMQAFSNIAGKV